MIASMTFPRCLAEPIRRRFSKLAGFDSNDDGLVNANDADFASLKIWQDVNGNHQTDANELLSLADAGLVSLSVGYSEFPFLDAQITAS